MKINEEKTSVIFMKSDRYINLYLNVKILEMVSEFDLGLKSPRSGGSL